MRRHPRAEESVHWTSTKRRQTAKMVANVSIVVEEGICPKKNVQQGEKPVENVRRGIISPECVNLSQVRRGRIPDERNIGRKELQTREQSMWFMVKIQMVRTVVMVIPRSLSM